RNNSQVDWWIPAFAGMTSKGNDALKNTALFWRSNRYVRTTGGDARHRSDGRRAGAGRHSDPRRSRGRGDQDRTARGRDDAQYRTGAASRHGGLLPQRQPQQEEPRPRPEAAGGARGAAAARRDRRR